MRLLVVSHAFPPFNSIGAVRTGKMVKYLVKHGHDVRVLTASNQSYQATLPLEIPEEQVIYSKWLTLRKGAAAPAATASRNGHSRPALSGRLRRGLTYLFRTFLYFPDAHIGWLPYAVAAGSNIIQDWRPDLIFASTPPPTSLLVAYRLSRKFGIPWVADLRDLWVDQQYYSQPGLRKNIEDRLERRILSSAAGLVTVSEPLAETLRNKYGKSTAVIRNGFDPPDYPSQRDVPFREGRIRIVYTGIVYEGRQDPAPLFQALEKLGAISERVRVAFYGSYYGDNQNSIRESAARYGVEGLVEVNPPVPYSESLKQQAEADLLLLLLWNDPTQRGVYTGKLFEYIGARRPILAVGESDNVAAELIRERGLGLATKEPDRIAARLKEWLDEKQQSGAIPRLKEEATVGMSREEQTSALEEYLSQIKENGTTVAEHARL